MKARYNPILSPWNLALFLLREEGKLNEPSGELGW